MSEETPRGDPRIQYVRTYILLPPNAGVAWASAVIDATWDDHRYTIGGSADDAGIGDLDVRRVLAVNPHEWPGDLEAFYTEYYPGVQYLAITTSEPGELALMLIDGIDWSGQQPSPPPPPPLPGAFPVRGLHDLSGADWMMANGLHGWCVQAEYLDLDPKRLDFRHYEAAGIRVIVRVNYSYAREPDGGGGQGTIAPVHHLDRFEDAVVQTIRDAQGVWGWVYCNEMNNEREWPRDTVVTPSYYLASYNRVWSKVGEQVRMSPGAIDPYNPGWGDWRESWREVLRHIRGADFWALHAYSHGRYDDHDKMFGDAPLVGVYYNLRVLESQMNILPYERLAIVTECNHYVKDNGQVGWENDGAWASFALDYLRRQGVSGVALFRYGFDQWNIDDKPRVLEALC